MDKKVVSIDKRLTFWQDFAKEINDGKISEAIVIYLTEEGDGSCAILNDEPDYPVLHILMDTVIDIIKDLYNDDEED